MVTAHVPQGTPGAPLTRCPLEPAGLVLLQPAEPLPAAGLDALFGLARRVLWADHGDQVTRVRARDVENEPFPLDAQVSADVGPDVVDPRHGAGGDGDGHDDGHGHDEVRTPAQTRATGMAMANPVRGR